MHFFGEKTCVYKKKVVLLQRKNVTNHKKSL